MSRLPDITQLEPIEDNYRRTKPKSEFDMEIELIGQCRFCYRNLTSIDIVYGDGFCSKECAEMYGKDDE